MNIDRDTAKSLPLGSRVTIETIEGHDRTAIRVAAPYLHMAPAFQWVDAPHGEHPLAWMDVDGRVRMESVGDA